MSTAALHAEGNWPAWPRAAGNRALQGHSTTWLQKDVGQGWTLGCQPLGCSPVGALLDHRAAGLPSCHLTSGLTSGLQVAAKAWSPGVTPPLGKQSLGCFAHAATHGPNKNVRGEAGSLHLPSHRRHALTALHSSLHCWSGAHRVFPPSLLIVPSKKKNKGKKKGGKCTAVH